MPKFGGTVIQTEDEIAACTMAIGANYGGVRTMTASAGPGLILNDGSNWSCRYDRNTACYRGYATWWSIYRLPTKQEQSDLNAMVYGTHGEIPKIVIAPSTIEECFYDTIEAFNLAEEYQCPVILMTDLAAFA